MKFFSVYKQKHTISVKLTYSVHLTLSRIELLYTEEKTCSSKEKNSQDGKYNVPREQYVHLTETCDEGKTRTV